MPDIKPNHTVSIIITNARKCKPKIQRESENRVKKTRPVAMPEHTAASMLYAGVIRVSCAAGFAGEPAVAPDGAPGGDGTADHRKNR